MRLLMKNGLNGRGANSITSITQPLYVVNKTAIGQTGTATDRINDIHPTDMEGIDMLKDGSYTAIYGRGGPNGVMISTTKRGSRSAPEISYDGYMDVVNPYNLPLAMNRPTFVRYTKDHFNAQAGYPPLQNYSYLKFNNRMLGYTVSKSMFQN